jgi:signal transduction histidine kinase/CheY-like chemotaxis protein
MQQAELTKNEAARLQALAQLDLLDTVAEEQFDHMTRFVKAYFNVPICLVSLVDKDRQWFKSKQGLDVCQTSRAISFCGHAIQADDVFVVEDTHKDKRFIDNPLVTDGPLIRFYAGYPLRTDSGYRIGTLCIIDSQPREFSYDDRQHLQDFGRVIEGLIRQRSAEINLDNQNPLMQRMLGLLTGRAPFWGKRLVAQSAGISVLVLTLILAIQTDVNHVIELNNTLVSISGNERLIETLSHYLGYFLAGTCAASLIYCLLRLPASLRKVIDLVSISQIRNERRFHDAIEALPDGFIIFDSKQKIAVFNKKFISIYSPLANVINVGTDYQSLRNNIKVRQLVKQPEILDVDDIRLRAPEREIELTDGRWIKIVESPMRDGGIVGFHIDITQSKLNELQLIEAKKKAEMANEIKSTFLANVSHEVRTPLNGILGLLDVILEEDNLNSQHRFYLSTMLDSSHSLLQILNDILDVSKMEAGKLSLKSEPFCLLSTLDSACELMKTNAKAKGLSLIVSLPDYPERMLMGDSGRIRQIVLNLLSNAIKFTPAGEVTLDCQFTPVSAAEISVSIKISDTGIGIPENMIKHILEPFTQVDNSSSKRHAGTGLGLAISHSLIKLMQGSLTIDSEEQSGTSISLELPFTLVDTPEKYPKKDIEHFLLNAKHLNILLADDDKTNQLVMQAMFEKFNCKLDVVSDGIEAVQAAKSGKYALILMDIYMPNMDGVTATTLIRQQALSSHTPIIAFTANAMEGDKQRFIDAGMDDYISKPVDKSRLLDTLNHYLASAN